MSSTGVDRITGIDPSVAIKAPCKVISTINIMLSGSQIIDGVLVTETTPKTRVVVNGQTSSINNGIYDVYDTTWRRSTDFNGVRDVVDSTMVIVDSGTIFGDTVWKVNATNPVNIGSTPINFVITSSFSNGILIGTTFGALAFTPATVDRIINIARHTSGTIGGGQFIGVAGSVTNDGGTQINSSTPGIYWKRINYPYLIPQYFGALGDGIANDAPACQLAASAISALGKGRLHFPVGTYILNSLVTFTNCDLWVSGDGVEVVKIYSNNSTGAFLVNLTQTRLPSPNIIEYACCFSDLSIMPMVSRITTWGGSGYAIRINRVIRTLDHQTMNQIFKNISIRLNENTPWQITGTSPQFDYGLYLTNASQTTIEDCFIDGPGCHGSTGLNIINSNDNNATQASYFALRIINSDINGWQYSINQTGWMESVYIDHCGIVGAVNTALLFDASATTYLGVLGCYNGHLVVSNCHINSQSRGIVLKNWKDVQLSDLNIYIAWTSSVPNVTLQSLSGIRIETTYASSETYIINNCYFNNTVSSDQSSLSGNRAIIISSASTNNLIEINGNIIKWYKTGTGVTAPNSEIITISGPIEQINICQNEIYGPDGGLPGLVIVSASPYSGNANVANNSFKNLQYCIYATDLSAMAHSNNQIIGLSGGGSAISWNGTNRGFMYGNNLVPYQTKSTISGATPRISDDPFGRFNVTNGGATNMTNLTNGYDGQIIDLNFTNGNTTVVHGATIFLQGSANTNFLTGTHLRLRLDGTVWIEQSRRT